MVSAEDAIQVDHAFIVDDGPGGDNPQAGASAGRDMADPPARRRSVLAVVFFALLVAHVAGNIDPRALYHADEALLPDKAIPIFPTYFQGGEFLVPFLTVPGGPAEYIGANVSQYFALPSVGAAILAVVALVAFVATGRLISLMGGEEKSLLRFVPPVLLVVIWNRYTFMLADQIALLAGLLVTYLYFRLPDRAVVRAVVFAALIVACCYVAGGLCMLPAAVCGLYELAVRRRQVGALYLVVGGLAPLVMGALLGVGVAQAYLRLTGLQGGGDVATWAWIGLYGFFVALPVGLALKRRAAPLRRLADRLRGRLGGSAPGRLGALGPSAAVLVVSAIVALATLDRDVRTFRRICFYYQTDTWGGVILEARKYVAHSPPEMYTAGVSRMVNRALFEERRLGSQMFHYPPRPLYLALLPGWTLERERELDQPYKTDTLLKLGAVPTAERLALESLRRWGDRPLVLRQLAKIAIVTEDTEAARDYLRRLSKDIVHGQFAKEQLAKIDAGYDFGDDEEIAQIRSFMVHGDFFGPTPTQTMLETLVDKHPNNRMAFEYLMAHYLLTRQLDRFASYVHLVARSGYEEMPPHYAEALMVRYVHTGQRPPSEILPRDAVTLTQEGSFATLYQRYAGDVRSLEKATSHELPGTYYWYYYYIQSLLLAPPSNADR